MCHQRKARLRRWVRASRVPDTGGRGIGEEQAKVSSQKQCGVRSLENVYWIIW